MSSYALWEAHVDRLRQVVLHSADVLPQEVASYLGEVAAEGEWERSKKVIAEPGPLIRHLPVEFTDFALEVLTRVDPEEGTPSLMDLHEFGFEGYLDFFPPAHVRGPFLALLRADEEQGLRLVNGLANTAVLRWRDIEQGMNRVTPLPQKIELPSGPREMWGNETVYYWFRTNGMAPYVVASALMALEFWIEEQVAGGRPASDLFLRILEGAECVAVAGACLSIALEFPEQCYEAALPLLSAPWIWNMDVIRTASEAGASFTLPGLTLPRHEYIEKLRTARDAQPHRQKDVRDLAMHLVVYGRAELRGALQLATERFTADLPFRFAEERDDAEWVAKLRDRMERFQLYGSISNYRRTQVDGQAAFVVVPPEEIQSRDQPALDRLAEQNLWLALDVWANKTLEARAPAPGKTLAEAVANAQQAERPGDFTVAVSFAEGVDAFRLRAVVGTAAAVVVSDFTWARAEGALSWCREVLLAASRTPPREDYVDSRYAQDPADPRVIAARGLGAIVSHGAGDSEVRGLLLALMTDPRRRIAEAVMQGLAGAWDADPVLCWNAIALGLSLSIVPDRLRPLAYDATPNPDEAAWREERLAEALQSLETGDVPPLPRVPAQEDGWYFSWGYAPRVLGALPLQQLTADLEAKRKLLQLLDDLIGWTVEQSVSEEDLRHSSSPPYEWNSFFMGWSAALARVLTQKEVAEHLLRPVRTVFDQAPSLTADLLKGYVEHHLGFLAEPAEASVEQWNEIAAWVLASERVQETAEDDYMGHTLADAVTLPIFVWQFGAAFKDEWPHAPRFVDIIERWVETVGTNPYAYGCLLTLLEGPGWNLVPTPAVRWVASCAGRSLARESFWREQDNANRTANFLQRVWHDHRDRVLRDSALRLAFSGLVDRLVARGVAVASLLQRKLEEDSRVS